MSHPVLAELFTNKAAYTRGEAQREAAWGALFVFPMLVFGPQKRGALPSAVKAEVVARLDLWNIGALEELAVRVQAFRRPPFGRSKTQRVARKAAYLLRKNQFARAR
jgi:hypothetical protein